MFCRVDELRQELRRRDDSLQRAKLALYLERLEGADALTAACIQMQQALTYLPKAAAASTHKGTLQSELIRYALLQARICFQKLNAGTEFLLLNDMFVGCKER
jgi:homogentisate 1,2-dioxygenase